MADFPTIPTFSVCTSVFNVEKMRFTWRDALSNWLTFLNGTGQLVIAVNKSEDNSATLIRDFLSKWHLDNARSRTKTLVLDIDIPYTDRTFDGQGKAAATAGANEPYVIFLDLDERLVPGQNKLWMNLARDLEMSGNEAFMVPSVDLIGDERHYKSVGSKWYIHKNLPHLTRGVVGFARRDDGTIDTDKSDTCELINRDTGELARSASLLHSSLPDFMAMGQLENGEIPFVYHLGWLDHEQRLRQSEFWRPVWDNREGRAKEDTMTGDKIAALPHIQHRLPTWRAAP